MPPAGFRWSIGIPDQEHMNRLHYHGPFSELELRDSRWRKIALVLACFFVAVLIILVVELQK
jgi:hypothetical protein